MNKQWVEYFTYSYKPFLYPFHNYTFKFCIFLLLVFFLKFMDALYIWGGLAFVFGVVFFFETGSCSITQIRVQWCVLAHCTLQLPGSSNQSSHLSLLNSRDLKHSNFYSSQTSTSTAWVNPLSCIFFLSNIYFHLTNTFKTFSPSCRNCFPIY